MAVVYVKEQGAGIHKRGGRLLVEKDDSVLAEVRLRETELVAVFGNVQVTTQALSELLERGIPLAYYTRNGRLKGRLVPEGAGGLELRLAQYRASADPESALAVAKPLVAAKLANSASLIEEYRSNYPGEELAEAAGRIREAAVRAFAAANVESLMGQEGAGAAAYFRAFSLMNRSGLMFDGREKHPARDPVNALLSLGYTMVMNEVRALAEGLGFEPGLGFLHAAERGRPSLALDLMEPFRAPVVDRLTLRLVNERILRGDDFAVRVSGTMVGGVILTPGAWRRYLEEYEGMLATPRAGAENGFRAEIRSEVAGLAGWLRGGAEFLPFLEGGGPRCVT